MQISAVIIAGNEESKIGEAIHSLGWADEVLVIESESIDRTREIAESLGARVITRPWPGFSKQKQFGVDAAANDWIFSLDADEVVSQELADEITKIKDSQDASADGYRVPRLSYYMGRAIKHSGWYPDWQLRLFDRRKGAWSDDIVHESVGMADHARIEKLRGNIVHRSYNSAAEHHEMIGTRYAPLAARQMFDRGRRTSAFKVATAPLAAFISTYVLKVGFLDGLPGYCIARFAAHHAYMKHLCLWELQTAASPSPHQD